ncbi:MAG TPA: glycosyl hydrolase family 65 protein [Longimicrobiales bacterium]
MARADARGREVGAPAHLIPLPPPLRKPFRVLAFDWDGTAVVDRREDAARVRRPLERLLRAGVPIAVITGTNFGNIDRQFSGAIRGPHKRHLFILANRGSEVYGFDSASRPVLLWRRVARPEEDRRLTAAADAVRDRLMARTGLEIGVIYDRLNRRKIDLIPVPEWKDPPKSALGALIRAVEARLRGAGLGGGLAEAFRLAQRTAREVGLEDARITSDVKHIEIGLTDKGDSIAWIMREIVARRGIPPDQVLVLGDEFGDIAGFAGSDAKLRLRTRPAPVYVSVGTEPGGAPADVIHLGGGPACFRAVVTEQARLHRRPPQSRGSAALEALVQPTRDPDWTLVETGFDLAREHEIESLFTIANGYVGVRGSLAEGSPLSAPAAFVAGIFAASEAAGGVPALVGLPTEWLALIILADGEPLRLDRGAALEHRRILDLRQGILWREWRHRDAAGRITRVRFLRLASLADRHLLLQSVTLLPENYAGRITLEAGIAATAPAAYAFEGPRAAPVRLKPGAPLADPADGEWSQVTTVLGVPDTSTVVALGIAGRLRTPDGASIPAEVEVDAGAATERWSREATLAAPYRLDRLITIETSRDTAHPADAAARRVRRAARGGLEAIVRAHVAAWAARWRDADIEVEGDDDAQRALRFACYHLIGAANPEDERVSVGARALTGEAYRGHVFWDTEIFMLPFYTFTDPRTARALLLYRYHTLPAAREKARRLGFRGAFYAWESADTGEESAPTAALEPDGTVIPIHNGEQEVHISADVAYAVWRYWQCTGDDRFLLEAGAEIVLETARFWASRGTWGADGRFHIERVTGPDEYHETVDDDAYTNLMAQWNLERGVKVAELLSRRWPERWHALSTRLGLTAAELEAWTTAAARMYLRTNDEGVLEQFRGYFDLEELDLSAFEPRTAPMDVLLGRKRIRASKVLKQADVVMLLHLLESRFAPATRAANFGYYEPRTGHGSSLSPSMHALVAARVDNVTLALRYFRQAAAIDLANNMGNAAGGVHAAALGGLWQAAIFGFGGLGIARGRLMLDPHLPHGWRALRFPLRWRGRRLRIGIEAEGRRVEVVLWEGDDVVVSVGGEDLTARAGRRYRTERSGRGWSPWRESRA